MSNPLPIPPEPIITEALTGLQRAVHGLPVLAENHELL